MNPLDQERKVVVENGIVELKNLVSENDGDARWQKRVEEAVTQIARAFGCVPREDDPFGPLEFIAKILYEFDCQGQGKIPTRWYKLQADMRDRFKQEAINKVASWASEELGMKRLDVETTRLVPRRPGQ